ncbi:MAG: Fic family protein [Planctomycetes bacterium]|nr:Fic family protein [Planctomycetota bacterium]
MYNTMFGVNLRSQIDHAGQAWAKKLPTELYTPPEVLLNTEQLGPARKQLQVSLCLKKIVPNADLWSSALIEAWEFHREELGPDGNGFFTQTHESATTHIGELAQSLEIACREDRKLFQNTALEQLDGIEVQVRENANAIATSRSDLLSHLDKITEPQAPVNRKTVCQLLESPHIANFDGMLGLNAILLIDAPSAVVAGRLRQNLAWVGPEGSGLEQATFVPPTHTELQRKVAKAVERWSGQASPFSSDSTDEVLRAMASFHHDWVALHPFEDGNGRVARVLSDYQAKHFLMHDAPLRLCTDEAYFPALAAADMGNHGLLVDLFSSKLKQQ